MWMSLIIALFLLSNCSSHKEFVRVEDPPHQFIKLEVPPEPKPLYPFRIHPQDYKSYAQYMELLRDGIMFYENQIDSYYLGYEKRYGKKYTMLEDDEIKNP